MSADSFEIRMHKPDVRTVLLPLDLSICTISDPPDLFAQHRFAFDTVMLIEGVVPTVGFHVKFVQKLVAGYATVAFGGSAPFDPEFDAAAVALDELAYAGAKRIIMISETGRPRPEHEHLHALINELGLQLEERSWKQLLE